MKIAYFASSRLPSDAANAVQVMKMCEAFAAAGHEVRMYARTGHTESSAEELFARYAVRHPFEIKLIDAPDMWALGGMLYGRKVAADIVSGGFKPDLLYGRNLHALFACRKMGVKMIYEAHAAPYNCLRQWLEDRLFNGPYFFQLVTINNALRDYYCSTHAVLNSGQIRVIVAHDGADDDFITDKPEPEKFCVGYAGGLFPGKGFEQIVAIARAMPEIEFRVVGALETIKTMSLPGNLLPAGRLEYKDVPGFLAGCSVLLAPYQRHVTTNSAGIGNIADWMSPLKIFEYMASRRAIVASRLPAIEEILQSERNALLVAPENISEWCQAIRRLQYDNPLRKRLADAACNDFKKMYTWSGRAAAVISGLRAESSVAEDGSAAGASGVRGGRIKCLHIIGDLDIGGTERMLCNLVGASDSRRFEHVVVSLLPPGPIAGFLLQKGVRLISLNMRRSWPYPADVVRLAAYIKRLQPDIIHTWMYYADLIGTVAARLAATRARQIFSIRHGSFSADPLRIKVAARAAAVMANRFADVIISCSDAALVNHKQVGYNGEKAVVIPNGFVLPDDKADRSRQAALCRRLGVPVSTILIGMIGRFHPVKDHANFIAAAEKVAAEFEEVQFVLAGLGVDGGNSRLVELLEKHGLLAKTHLLGAITDVNEVVCGLSLLVSSSAVEAFANVIGEAMACQVPCVATDVGESAQIIGDTGIIVAAQNSQALADGIRVMLKSGREGLLERGRVCRERIEKLFGLDLIVKKFESIYSEVINERSQH